MRTRRSTRRGGLRLVSVRADDDATDGRLDASDLAARNDVATEQLADGRLDTAAVAFKSLLDDCRWRLGAEHPETLVVEGNLAVTYVMVGQQDAGTHLLVANLARRERVFGDEHPLTLAARDALATAHRLTGRLPEALWQYSRVAPQRNRVLGPAHPDTLTTRLGLGLTFAAAGDRAMARDVLAAALEDCERVRDAHGHAELLRSCLADLRPDPAVRPEAGSPVRRAPDPPVRSEPDGPAMASVPRQRGADPAGPARLPMIDVGSGAPRVPSRDT